jgi:hypothetical protein
VTVSLRNRIGKLELITGGRVPTEREFLEAMALIDRHFAAIGAPEIFEFEADPAEVLPMKAAEATGKVAAARDIRERYERAKSYVDPDPQAVLAELREFFGINEDGTPNPDKQPWLAKGGSK